MTEFQIKSLNLGQPQKLNWNGRQIETSMDRRTVAGPLVVYEDRVESNDFSQPQYHGTRDSILYAWGLDGAHDFLMKLHEMRKKDGEPETQITEHLLTTGVTTLGGMAYRSGALGENITLERLIESDVSVGDVFEFGEVRAQAVMPRIPCAKVNFRVQNKHGQKALGECLRSGVYFRILQPGRIHAHSRVQKVAESQVPFSMTELYQLILAKRKLTASELARAEANGGFSQRLLEKWRLTVQSRE